ncbi:hypothetical protein [Intrasporangium calvum]|uniref:hypothetical protein n=1 Tax=Intrasporangium calvum TaxID=53358 RepID=UPI00145DC0DA|nr:hypothetical protein [Intrasporangium calvum]
MQLLLDELTGLVQRVNPSALIITANYDPAIRLVALAARQAGVPVALYPHGLSSPNFWLERNDGLASHFLCWTEEERLGYIAAGVRDMRVRVVGPLRSPRSWNADRRPVDFDLLWLGHRFRAQQYIPTLDRIRHEAEDAGFRLAYRPHPLEDPTDVGSLLPGALLNPRVGIGEHLESAKVVVGGVTTGLIEAAMLGRRTIFIEDLDAIEAPEVRSHLRRVSTIATLSNDFSIEQVRLVMSAAITSESFLSPEQEIPKLINSGWFRRGDGAVTSESYR